MHYSRMKSFARTALGAKPHNCEETKNESKKYSKGDVLAVFKELRSINPLVGIVGKSAEVVRGLYDTCNVLQFYWGSDRIGIGRSGYDEICGELTKLNCTHFTPIRSHNSRAILSEKGIIYTFPAVEVFGRITEDDFDKEGLVTPIMNHAFNRHMKFYDEEMENQDHYTSVVTFLREINGDAKDVLAIRALLEFAEKKSRMSHEKFEEARSCTDHPEKYDDLYNYIMNQLDGVLV